MTEESTYTASLQDLDDLYGAAPYTVVALDGGELPLILIDPVDGDTQESVPGRWERNVVDEAKRQAIYFRIA